MSNSRLILYDYCFFNFAMSTQLYTIKCSFHVSFINYHLVAKPRCNRCVSFWSQLGGLCIPLGGRLGCLSVSNVTT